MVKSLVLIMLVVAATTSAHAQVLPELKGFFRMKSKPVFLQRRAPSIALSQDHAIPYWQGSSYTYFSENGRIKTTVSFDVHGQLRESFSSINLKSTGALSYWRIQFSPRRTQPMLVYTIH
jgi:hypothetical protein